MPGQLEGRQLSAGGILLIAFFWDRKKQQKKKRRLCTGKDLGAQQRFPMKLNSQGLRDEIGTIIRLAQGCDLLKNKARSRARTPLQSEIQVTVPGGA